MRTGTRSHAPRDRNSKQQDSRPSASVGDSARGAPEAPRKPAPFQTRPPPQAQRGEQPSRPDASSERHESPVPGPDVSFYVQKAEEDDASGERVKLVACRLCGRKFAEDRVQKHLDACKVSQKKRKVFDPVQMRTDGTEMAKYVSRGDHKKETPVSVALWDAKGRGCFSQGNFRLQLIIFEDHRLVCLATCHAVRHVLVVCIYLSETLLSPHSLSLFDTRKERTLLY